MRKMLVAMAKDVRVLIIKLADRLHNMRTLAAMPEFKQQRTAQETVDIYAPLAHRLGMQDLKQQLEDLSFAAMHPKRYAEIDHMVATRAPERELYLAQVLEEVRLRLAELRIDAEVTGRPKHLWSIYEKMVVKGKAFDDIFDLVGIRVTVDAVKDCYAALGSIHSTWTPVQGRFKDYIAMPKFNLYQSLHTTVVGPQGKPLEVQIRTREMHQRAEFGVAAHWSLQGRRRRRRTCRGSAGSSTGRATPRTPKRSWQTLKVDLEQDEVYVFTPKGKVLTLAGRGHADRLRLQHPHRGRPRVHRRPGQRAARAARLEARARATRSRSSRRRSRAPGRRATGSSWSPRLAPPTRSASGSPGSGARTPSRTAATTSSRRCGGRACRSRRSRRAPCSPTPPASSTTPTSTRCTPPSAKDHVSAKSVAARIARVLRGGDPDAEEQLPTTVRQPRRPSRSGVDQGIGRRPRRGTRRRHGAALEVLHAGAGRRPARASSPRAVACRCTGPTAPTPCRSRAAPGSGSSRSSGTSSTPGCSWPPSR